MTSYYYSDEDNEFHSNISGNWWRGPVYSNDEFLVEDVTPSNTSSYKLNNTLDIPDVATDPNSLWPDTPLQKLSRQFSYLRSRPPEDSHTPNMSPVRQADLNGVLNTPKKEGRRKRINGASNKNNTSVADDDMILWTLAHLGSMEESPHKENNNDVDSLDLDLDDDDDDLFYSEKNTKVTNTNSSANSTSGDQSSSDIDLSPTKSNHSAEVQTTNNLKETSQTLTRHRKRTTPFDSSSYNNSYRNHHVTKRACTAGSQRTSHSDSSSYTQQENSESYKRIKQSKTPRSDPPPNFRLYADAALGLPLARALLTSGRTQDKLPSPYKQQETKAITKPYRVQPNFDQINSALKKLSFEWIRENIGIYPTEQELKNAVKELEIKINYDGEFKKALRNSIRKGRREWCKAALRMRMIPTGINRSFNLIKSDPSFTLFVRRTKPSCKTNDRTMAYIIYYYRRHGPMKWKGKPEDILAEV